MSRSDQTAFSFEILEGPMSGAILELNGRELPYRSGSGGQISFGGQQRTKLTWYPGNREASQQIIGPILEPTTINGVWKERYLGENAPIDLVEAFEILRDSGVQIRVTWQTIERRGIIKSFKWTPGNPVGGLGDIGWEMSLEWVAAGTPSTRVVGPGEPALRDQLVSCADLMANLGASISAFITLVGTFVGMKKTPFQIAEFALAGLLGDFAQPIGSLTSAASIQAEESTLPPNVAFEAAAAAANAQYTAAQVGEVTAGIFPGSVTIQDSIEDVLAESIRRYDIIDSVLETMESAYEQRLRLEAIARPGTYTKIAAFAGGDLREVARKFYGDPDAWQRIANLNGIPTSMIPYDIDELLIPLSLSAATGAS